MQQDTATTWSIEGKEGSGVTIGLDVGDRYTHVHALGAGGEVVRERRVRTTTAALGMVLTERDPARRRSRCRSGNLPLPQELQVFLRVLQRRGSTTEPNLEEVAASIGVPQEDWTPIPYWLPGGADVAEMTYTPFRHTRDATAVRLIVRRVTRYARPASNG